MRPGRHSVSVAMATYNGGRFLHDQLASIAAQTRYPDELVVTEDSPDGATFAILESFAKTAPFSVRLFKNEKRLGYKANFLKALSLCTGDLVVLCDQDDVWATQKIEKVIQPFVDDGVLLAIHDVQPVDENLQAARESDRKNWHLRGCYPPLTTNPWYLAHGMSMTIRREVLNWLQAPDLDQFPDGYGHDAWLWCVTTSLGKVVGLEEELALYRQHGNNVFGAPRSRSLKRSILRSAKTGGEHYSQLASTSLRLSENLAGISPAAPPGIKASAQEASTFYRTLAQYYTARNSLYSASSRAKRMTIMSRLVSSGAYRPVSKRGLGRRALLKDVIVALLNNQSVL